MKEEKIFKIAVRKEILRLYGLLLDKKEKIGRLEAKLLRLEEAPPNSQ